MHKDYPSIVVKVANRYPDCKEDLLNELYIEYETGKTRYNKEKNDSYDAFIYIRLVGHAIDYVNRYSKEIYTLDNFFDQEDSYAERYIDNLEDEFDLEKSIEDNDRIIERLDSMNSKEKKLINFLMDNPGCSQKQIVWHMEMDRKTLIKRYSEILKAFK